MTNLVFALCAGCATAVIRVDVSSWGTSCLVSDADMAALPTRAAQERYDLWSDWPQEDGYSRFHRARACCAYEGGRHVGMQYIEHLNQAAPLCLFGGRRDPFPMPTAYALGQLREQRGQHRKDHKDPSIHSG